MIGRQPMLLWCAAPTAKSMSCTIDVRIGVPRSATNTRAIPAACSSARTMPGSSASTVSLAAMPSPDGYKNTRLCKGDSGSGRQERRAGQLLSWLYFRKPCRERTKCLKNGLAPAVAPSTTCAIVRRMAKWKSSIIASGSCRTTTGRSFWRTNWTRSTRPLRTFPRLRPPATSKRKSRKRLARMRRISTSIFPR